MLSNKPHKEIVSFKVTVTTEIYTPALHGALLIGPLMFGPLMFGQLWLAPLFFSDMRLLRFQPRGTILPQV